MVGGSLVVVTLSVMSVRIVDTHRVFSGTIDEPVHLAAGVELLSLHRYELSPEHTPLARITAAIGPIAHGARFRSSGDFATPPESVMRTGPGYRRNLELGRLGILPFFIVAGVCLYFWARRVFTDSVAVIAVVIYSFIPPVLAHSGLVTTDAAAMATFTGLLLAFQLWLERPDSQSRTIWLGIAAGAAAAAKLSAIPFFIATSAIVLPILTKGWRRPSRPPSTPVSARELVRTGLLVSIAALVTLYATYGFTLGRSLGFPAPLSEFIFGLLLQLRHNIEGSAGYLLGETYLGSRWAYFPVVLAVKTPIPVLTLGLAGIVIAVVRWWKRLGIHWIVPVAATFAPLAVAMALNINLGVRHLLPLYPPLALLSAVSVVAMWSASFATRILVLLLGAWLLVGTWRVHPDYLAYFNEFANDDPGAVLVDSDLDWGQDLERLADTVRARGIENLSIAYFGRKDRLTQLFPTARLVGPREPRPTGWFAVSETWYRRGWTQLNRMVPALTDSLTWLREYEPVTKVGPSMRLYYIRANGR